MNKKILIIDDELDVVVTLRIALQQYATLAYKNFRAGVYDLVLLDIKMPIVDGFQLYQKIKRTDSRIKICFLTAGELYHEEIRKEQGYERCNEEVFLRKPIEIPVLVNAINNLLN